VYVHVCVRICTCVCKRERASGRTVRKRNTPRQATTQNAHTKKNLHSHVLPVLSVGRYLRFALLT
jgi:hypothetical protein